MLDDLQGILGACRVGKTRQLTQDLNYRRAGELPPVLLHPLRPDRPPSSGERWPWLLLNGLRCSDLDVCHTLFEYDPCLLR